MSMPAEANGARSAQDLSPRLRRALLDGLCRESFVTFFHAGYRMLNPGKPIPDAPYVQAMLHRLEQLVIGDARRLVVNVPPRHGKSEFGTCMLSAWILGRDPTAKIFIVSYGLGHATNLTGKVRRLMQHGDYRRIFPGTRLKVGENRAEHFVTTAGGECMAASQDSAITGFGTQYMLIDDFQKADDALSPVRQENAITTVRNTLISRFDELGAGRILINQQRLHENDISGWALSLGWPQLRLPAIAEEDETHTLPFGKIWHRKKGDLLDPVRAPMTFLEEMRIAQGDRHFAAQYQQDPGAGGSGLVDWQWFGQYDTAPPRRRFLKIVQSWDPAMTDTSTSDYSVGMTWGYDGENWFLLDLVRVRSRFNHLLERVIAEHARWKADALIIEGASIGLALFEQVRPKVSGKVVAPTPRLSKSERLSGCSAQLASGAFLLPREAPWLSDFRHELLAFPDARNDDQVDALTQFLDYVRTNLRWVQQRFDENGRPETIVRPSRPRGYPR